MPQETLEFSEKTPPEGVYSEFINYENPDGSPGGQISKGNNILATAATFVSEDVSIEEGARIEGDVTIGAGSVILSGANVRRGARIGERAIIGSGTEIRDQSIIGNGAKIGDNVWVCRRGRVADDVCVPDNHIVAK